MKKLLAGIAGVIAILANNEIVTLLILALLILGVAIFILAAWAKSEKPKLPGSFEADWGKK